MLIQQINLFGISADKFERILRVLIATHIYQDNQTFLLHTVPLKLTSKKVFEHHYRKQLERTLNDGFDYLSNTSFYKHFLSSLDKTMEDKKTRIAKMVETTRLYILQRRHWFKALDILQDVACSSFRTMERNQLKESFPTD
jgi:flagellar biosynthesis chaperone FliJ